MRFCPNCDNLLIPKKKSLYCKACEKNLNFNLEIDDYTIIKTIKHDNNESEPIIIKNRISMNFIKKN